MSRVQAQLCSLQISCPPRRLDVVRNETQGLLYPHAREKVESPQQPSPMLCSGQKTGGT